MTDKVQKIREEVARMHNLLPVMDGDNISVNYADRICTTLEMYIDSLQEEPVSNPIDFEKELYKAFGQVKDFTLGMRIAKYFYDMGKNSQEPASEELEEELSKLLKECEVDAEYVHQDFLHIVARHFANWQKEKMMANAVERKVLVSPCGIPCIDATELYDYDDDKVKVIVIKEG